MPDARAYLSKYKEVLDQIWSRGCGGCNSLEDIFIINQHMNSYDFHWVSINENLTVHGYKIFFQSIFMAIL